MSFDQPETPLNAPAAPARKRMSTGTKILLILAIVFGGLLVLCCGGMILLGLYAQSYAKTALSDDPAAVQETAAEITQIDVPADFEPNAALNLKVPFTGQKIVTAAIYLDEETHGALILGAVGEVLSGQDQAQIQQQIKQALQQQGMESADGAELDLTKIREIQREIRGQPATFVIYEGRDDESGKEIIQATGTFRGNSGPALLLLLADRKKHDEQQVVEIIESIR